jgi:hypothetical protein
MPITALPTPPSRNDPTNFATRADAFMAALPAFATETNATAVEVDNDRIASAASATTATTQVGLATAQVGLASAQRVLAETAASAASATANVTQWVSGTTYALGANVWSPINAQTYRRIIAGAGTTDPSADATNWTKISENLTIASQAEMQAGTETGLRSMSPLRIAQAITALAGGAKIQATASGAITAGKPCVINTDGTVSQVTATAVGSLATSSSGSFNTGANNCVTYDTKRNRYYLFRYATETQYGSYVYQIGTPNIAGSLSWSAPVVIYHSGAVIVNFASQILCSYDAFFDRVIFVYQHNALNCRAFSAACSDVGLAFANTATDVTSTFNLKTIVYDPVYAQHIMLCDVYSSYYITAKYIKLSTSDSFTQGNTATIDSSSSNYDWASIALDTANLRAIVTWKKDANNNVAVCTYGNLSFTKNADQPISGATKPYVAFVSSNKYVFSYNNASEFPTFVIGTLSSNTMTYGTPVVLRSTNQSSYWSPIVVLSPTRFFTKLANFDHIGNISGTTITNAISVSSSNAASSYQYEYAFSPTFQQVLYITIDPIYRYFPTSTTNLTQENYLGIALGTYSNAQTADIQIVGAVNTSQSGLTTALKYYADISGNISTVFSGVYAGLASAATKLIVKG